MKRYVLKDTVNCLYEEERSTCTRYIGIRSIVIGYDYLNYSMRKSHSQKTSKSALEARDKLLKKLAKDKFYEHTLTMVAIEVVE